MCAAAHGVVVIHGVGENQRPGEFLARVANGLADALEESGGIVDREMSIASDPTSGELHITDPSSTTHHWIFREAFWADSFPAPAPWIVLRWMMRQAGSQLGDIWRGWWSDPANNEDFQGMLRRSTDETAWRANFFLKSVYRLELLAMGAVLVPLSVIMPAIYLVLWPLYWLPRIGPLERFLKFVHALDPFLSKSLGDTQSYVENGMWSASVRGVLERVVIDMLNDRHGQVDDITIVAHSMGCVVTYDALSRGGAIADEVQRLSDAGSPPKKITFVSLGSAINGSFRLARTSSPFAQERFSRPLDARITGYDPSVQQDPKDLKAKFFWIDVYSRFDPGPAGELDPEIEAQASIHPDQVKRRRVINLDNPLRDHSYYFVNKNLVAPRIARAINGGEHYPWPDAGITAEKVRRHIKGVAWLVALRLLLAAVVLANVIFLLWNDGWRAETMERLETAIIRLPGLDNVYCQATNGVLHASRYHKLTEAP